MNNKLATIHLKKPITRGEQTIEQLQLREPMAGDLRQLKLLDVLQSDIDSYAILLPRITTPALTANEIYTFNLLDLSTCAEAIASFLEPDEKSSDA